MVLRYTICSVSNHVPSPSFAGTEKQPFLTHPWSKDVYLPCMCMYSPHL